jgi:hypothetical protein
MVAMVALTPSWKPLYALPLAGRNSRNAKPVVARNNRAMLLHLIAFAPSSNIDRGRADGIMLWILTRWAKTPALA